MAVHLITYLMKPLSLFSIFSSVVAVLALPVASAAQQWETTGGPLGGSVTALLTIDGTTFAGTQNGGLFQSGDLGDNWTRLDVVESLESITGLAHDSEGRVFASTSRGVRRSTNAGATCVSIGW